MKLRIEDALFEEFAPVIGVIAVTGADNTGSSSAIADLLRAEEDAARARFSAEGSLGAHPGISAWRKAYKKLGADSYRASSEALSRRAIKGDEIPSINKLVDLYNVISLRHTIPVGGEDLDAMRGEIVLGYANGSEAFVRIGGTENEPPAAGEVVYRDEAGVVCRRWNWREADRTKLTEKTSSAIIVLDGLEELGGGIVVQATEELLGLILAHCGGSASSAILDRENRICSL